MNRFGIGNIVIFNEESDSEVFELLEFTYNKEYVILHVHTGAYSILDDLGSIRNISGEFLTLSPVYRNRIIDEILS